MNEMSGTITTADSKLLSTHHWLTVTPDLDHRRVPCYSLSEAMSL
jgi:hypothetical protein